MGQRRPLGPRGTWRKGGSSAAAVPTSLPPLVQGPPHCFLCCSVPRVVWTVTKPPAAAVFVHLRWWGETSNGTIFEPGCPGKNSARYAVCCGPRRFADYLSDMAVLVLEVVTKPDHLPIGRAEITQLSQLSPSNPINGFFPIISPTADKLGELQVSLILEPLSGVCDTSSSVPAAGASPAQRSSKFLSVARQSKQKRATAADQGSVNHSRATAHRKDHSLLQENSENMKDPSSASRHRLTLPDELLEANSSKPRVSFPAGTDPEAPARTNTRVLSLHNPATKDLLSALLDQGNKLRDAMVVSAMKSSPDMEIELNELPPFKERSKLRALSKSPRLDSNVVPAPEDPRPFTSEVSGQRLDLSSEERVIELLLGSADLSPVHFWDHTGSLLDSLSLGSEVYDSELNDPHYDQSLLESLFYTTPKSDSSLSDFLSDDDVNPSKKGTKGLVIPQELGAFDHDREATEVKPRPPAPPEEPMEAACVTSLSAARLALLERIRLARVVIESLKIPPENAQPAPNQQSLAGRPPRPTPVNKCTFFVEYPFPVGASQDAKGQVSISTEVIRIASSKISGGVVKFQQRFVAPVRFSGTMVQHWWSANLPFKVYTRKGTQKKPVAIGSAALRLRQVIESELLTVSCEIPVEKEGGQAQAGSLKVSLELAADNKDFTRTAARCAVAAPQVTAHAVRSPSPEFQEPSGKSSNAESPGCVALQNCEYSQKRGATSASIVHPPTPVARNTMTQISASEEDGLLLHLLLMVPDGRDFVADVSGLHSSCNVYLNCKLLSTEEAMQSAVVWGTTQPTFNFSQVIPFSLTSKLLERLKNNIMIIEAWNKMGSPGCDRLLGLVKLPLHQFYISFQDPNISQLLLQAQYPVVAVDSYMPVVNVFTGSTSGSLRVVLAMGSADQILALQRLKNEAGLVPPIAQRPSHPLNPPPAQLTKQLVQEGGDLTEHVFEISVESVKGLTPLQSAVWGEADCYVQYYFPVQEPHLDEDGIRLKPFRTATTLCVPNPVFSDARRHSLLVPADDPVQRLLVSAFMVPGVAGGGIQFEVWCRYYYPNVRDQMVAKGTLPLSRLCAMVTMQHHEEIGIQTFNLPLIPRAESSEEFHLQSSGLLDVSVRYQQSMRRAAGRAAQTVSLAVRIHRAAGLQAAARAVAQKNPSLQHCAGVGVNAYVSVHFSFLPEAERRNTRPVAGTFCPEFEHHVEFPCNLVVQKSSGEASSLGELLQSASIIFSIYHQSTKSAQTSRDYLLGTVSVPTRDLLGRRSGISGWYPVTLPEDLVSSHCTNVMQAVVGGLELSVSFARQDDRERVLEAAELLGWMGEESHEDSLASSEDWEQSAGPVTVTISAPRVWLPVHTVLWSGQRHLSKSTFCYLRYKLYNQEATWTLLRRPRLSGDAKSVTMNFRKPTTVTLRRSQGLLWFFREEKLEIQVWWAHGKANDVRRPLDTDRLIGSAYVDLAALAERSGTTTSVNGVYPLFRCNAANLAGAAVRVHIVLTSVSAAALPSRLCRAEECSSSEDESAERAPGESQPISESPGRHRDAVSAEGTKPAEDEGVFLENTVAVNILVERAMHLSLKGSPLTEREVAVPSSCVSFAVAGADAPVSTAVIENTESPVWDFQQEARLSKELLLDPQQTLVFKVWHKAETERVIGFASVDLSPLLSGFQLVCGWYNITDFSGQCRGQIKVAVSPLQSIQNLKEERQARIRTQPPRSPLKAGIPAPPSNTTAFPGQTLSPSTKEAKVPSRERPVASRTAPLGAQTPRHDEHMQNVRRFHESLQQAEGKAPWAAETLFSSLSSRDSLLTALRKNLSELDEVQRYFSTKMTRSFPDFTYGSKPKPRPRDQESDRRGSSSRDVDPGGCRLWDRHSQLVSRGSSLATDLQAVTTRSEESSTHQDGSSRPGTTHGHRRRDEDAGPELDQHELGSASELQQPPSRGSPVFERHMLHQLLAQAVPEGEHPVPADPIPEDEGATQPHSEGEYEEDIVEPRALNEVTIITDKTSPWSSVVSEVEQQPVDLGPDDRHLLGRDCSQNGSSRQSSVFSSLLQGDSHGALTTLGLPEDESSPWAVAEGLQHGGTTEEEPLQPPPVSGVCQKAGGPAENGHWDWLGAHRSRPGAGSEEQQAFPAETGLASPRATQGEKGASSDVVGEGCQDGEESGSGDVCFGSVSAQVGSEEGGGSLSGASSEEPEPAADLPSPIVVPNFFLPPQQMEASMRLLSLPSEPPTALRSKEGTAGEPCGVRRGTGVVPRPVDFSAHAVRARGTEEQNRSGAEGHSLPAAGAAPSHRRSLGGGSRTNRQDLLGSALQEGLTVARDPSGRGEGEALGFRCQFLAGVTPHSWRQLKPPAQPRGAGDPEELGPSAPRGQVPAETRRALPWAPAPPFLGVMDSPPSALQPWEREGCGGNRALFSPELFVCDFSGEGLEWVLQQPELEGFWV